MWHYCYIRGEDERAEKLAEAILANKYAKLGIIFGEAVQILKKNKVQIFPILKKDKAKIKKNWQIEDFPILICLEEKPGTKDYLYTAKLGPEKIFIEAEDDVSAGITGDDFTFELTT